MPETLTIPIPISRKENRRRKSPHRQLIIFLATLIGIAVAIAAHQQKEPSRLIAAA